MCGFLIVVTSVVMEVWHMGLVTLWHVESSQTRDGTHDRCLGRWILNHWTNREVQEAPQIILMHDKIWTLVLVGALKCFPSWPQSEQSLPLLEFFSLPNDVYPILSVFQAYLISHCIQEAFFSFQTSPAFTDFLKMNPAPKILAFCSFSHV